MTGDLEPVARWAAGVVGGPRARVVAVIPLRPGGSPWLLHLERATFARAVLKTGSVGSRPELATEAAALRVAEEHDLPTPRLLASDLDGSAAGCLAVLMTHVEGSDRIPATTDVARLRAAGAAAAAFHRVSVNATPELPMRHRHMPWIDFSDERRRGESPTTALLAQGDQLVAESEAPTAAAVLVHGDLWVGNMLWLDGACVATIDWEAAGVGHYGVDLGSLRLDAALLHGPRAADEVLAGWEAASGAPAGDVAYWDLVAALNTPADMSGFTPTIHQAGRTDLDGTYLTRRRDAFLAAAIDGLA